MPGDMLVTVLFFEQCRHPNSCLVPDKTTWLDTEPSCLAPDFPVDYSSGSDFGEAVAFRGVLGTLVVDWSIQTGNLGEKKTDGYFRHRVLRDSSSLDKNIHIHTPSEVLKLLG